jgi:hypothetical protein
MVEILVVKMMGYLIIHKTLNMAIIISSNYNNNIINTDDPKQENIYLHHAV